MGTTITIKSTEISTVSGAPGKSVNGEGSGLAAKDASFEVYQSPGTYAVPVNGDIGLTITIGESRIVVAVNDYGFSLNIQSGEHIAYARDSNGTTKCHTWHKNTGEIYSGNDNGNHTIESGGDHVFNDGTVSAVKFDELKTGFDQLKSDYDVHTHMHSPGPLPPVPSAPPPSPSTASIDDAEVTEVKFP